MRKYDVIICGAGPAGLTTGLSILKTDKNVNVLILESRKEVGEEKCGEGLSESWFKHMSGFGKFLRSKLDSKCFDNKIRGTKLILPSGKEIIAKEKKSYGWTIDKDYFLKNLASIFEKIGGEIQLETKVKGPVIKGKIVYGIETDKREMIRGECVVDATGLNQNIWRKVLNITEPIDKEDIEVCCQYKVKECDVGDPDIIQIYFGNEFAPGGYGWVFPKSSGRANVGVGCQGSRVKSAVPFQEKFWRMLGLGGEIISKKGGTVSCFPLPESFVWSNLTCVGASARFTNPIHGGGTGPAMFGGYILGKHLGEALRKNEPLERALINYQEEIKSGRGKAHRYHYRGRNLLQSCNDEELEIIFSSIEPNEWMKSMSFTRQDVMKILGRISKKSMRLALKITRYIGLGRSRFLKT